MNISIIPDSFSINTFNNAALHPMQSWQWGEARQKMGIDIVRFGEFEGDDLKSVFQITFHKIPYTNFTIGYLPRSIVPSKDVCIKLIEEGKKRSTIFIKLEPYVKTSNTNVIARSVSDAAIPVIRRSPCFARDDNIIKSPYPLFPDWTQIVDLAKSEEELYKNCKSKTRYNIRLAQKRGVKVTEETTSEGFEKFAKLYFETCKRQKYRGHTISYHRKIFENLKNKISHIFIAYYKGSPLSVYHIFTFNDVGYYVYGGSSEKNKNTMAANLLMWESLLFSKRSGCKTFDMWGSLSPDYDMDSAWGGFTRFKQGYGGEFIELVGSYDLILHQNLYKLYNIGEKIRRIIL